MTERWIGAMLVCAFALAIGGMAWALFDALAYWSTWLIAAGVVVFLITRAIAIRTPISRQDGKGAA